MEQNKTGKYLKYAIGEIVLVVIGILIALSINNWNEGRKVKEQQNNFISNIKEDLTIDRQNLINIINIQNERYINTGTLLREIPNITAQNKPKLDSLFMDLLYDNPTFYPTVGSYQSALASGKLNQFENNAIITKIIRLYDSQFTRLGYNGEALDARFFNLIEKYKYERRTKRLREMTPTQIISLQDDIDWYGGINEFYLKRCKETLLSLNDIIESN